MEYPKQGDFLVQEKWLFEIGGRNKKADQVKTAYHYYLAVDDREVGLGRQIPLWLFGMLY